MPTGFHGAGGLDIPTMLHIMKMFVIPILLYGLEVILPKQTLMDQLELCQTRILKQLFMLPTNTSDIAVYALSGLLPVPIQIHKRALILYNNICLQHEDSVERRLACRQLTVKGHKSASWFVDVRKLFWQCDLGDPDDLLTTPLKKEH
ncbi:hypothetical protein DPMN_179125 [Dreissena polymorpha]|uniref:Uncharacterized protein n=1 Tax=Dreissena polymorpha TaxID=45954 RepID=A0A9D4EGK0_DREPO|nr:hypothetical protein DPMN_179125 [Dreissena polymorpha]